MIVGGNYTIDFAKVSNIPKFTVSVKAGDSKRKISLTLLENNVVINLNNYTVVVACKKSDGTDIFNDVNIVDSINGKCEVEITEQMLALDTDLPCEIVLYGINGVVATSSNFVIGRVSSVRDNKNIVSSSEFITLSNALTKVTNINKKMDRGESILVSQIDKNKGKIDQTYLSEELISQITGNASINAMPADNSITNNKLAPNSLAFNKFEGFRIDERFNLWDKNNLNPNGYYNEQGSWVNDSTYGSTGFIPIDYTKTYKQNFGGYITFWDSEFNFICKGSIDSNSIVIIPNDDRIAYFNSATRVNGSSNKYIVLSEHEINKDYVKFSSPNLLIKDNNLDKEDLKLGVNNVDFITTSRTINLFDKDNCAIDYYLNKDTGNRVYGGGYYATNFMPVDYTKEYIGSTEGHISYYDENKKYLFGNRGNTTLINNDSRVKYCVMTYNYSMIDTWMCVEGDTLPNTYVPYLEKELDVEIKVCKDSLPNDLIEKIDEFNKPISAERTNFINIERTENLFNAENMNTKGYYNSTTGTFVEDSTYGSSELIEVEEGEYYRIWKTSGYITFFDENKVFCGGSDSDWDGLVPQGVKYISWVIYLDHKDIEVIWKNKQKPTTYIPYYKYTLKEEIALPSKARSELEGLTWNVMGDSISSTNYANSRPYWYHLAQENNMQVRNYAISGAWISKGGNQTISEAWETMEDEADIITVFAGTNDNLNTNPLGTMEDRTNTTFYGALHTLYNGLINKYPGKKIGIISIMLRSGYRAGDNSTWDRKNNAILEVAKYYNLPVFKAHEEFNLNANIPLIKEKFIEDGLHPNEEGQKIMARRLKKWLESL